MSPIDRFAEIPSTPIHTLEKEGSQDPLTVEGLTASIVGRILDQRPFLGLRLSINGDAGSISGDGRNSLGASLIKLEQKERDFLETLLFGDLLSLEKLLVSKQISRQFVQIGLKMAFKERKVGQFYLLEQYFEGDKALFEELFYLELARGGTEFLSALMSKFPLTQEVLQRGFDIAVFHRNGSGMQFLSECEMDRQKILEHLLKAVESNDFFLGVSLYGLDLDDSLRREAFLRACRVENVEFVKQFHSIGVNSVFMGEAFLEMVCDKKQTLIFLLLRLGVETSYLDLGLEFLAVDSDEPLFFSLMEYGPSRVGLVEAFFCIVSMGEEGFAQRLMERVQFGRFELVHAMRLAHSHGHMDLSASLQGTIESLDELGFDEELEASVHWTVDLSELGSNPERFLVAWIAADFKPISFRFLGEDGMGEGLTRQFYAQLCEALFIKIFDGEGLPQKGDFAIEIFRYFAILLSWMWENHFKIGLQLNFKWLKILQLIQSSNRFVCACFPQIYRNLFDTSRLERNLLYQFIQNTTSPNRDLLLKTFQGEISFLDFESKEPIEQKKLIEEFLMEKFGNRILIDFLEQSQEGTEKAEDLRRLAQKTILKFYGESLEETNEILEYCQEIRKEFWERSMQVFKFSKRFLSGCSPALLDGIRTSNLQQLTGEPLEELYKLTFSYQGSDEGILAKIALLKEYIKNKCDNKDHVWLKNFLFFVGGSGSYTLDKACGIVAIKEESYPQAQTCFFLLKLASGYDELPAHLSNWKERFQYKLEEAMKVQGYQLEQQS